MHAVDPTTAGAARLRPRLAALLALLVLAATFAGCTLPPPSGQAPLRYRDVVFQSVTIERGLTYGSAPGASGQAVALKLDLYRPTGDTATRRPAVVWVHGGGFTSGSRTAGNVVALSNEYARRGYVAVSISYRLLSSAGCGATPGPQCPVAAQAAQHDAQAAVRWLRANADRYRIDPKRIAIGGSSAGAVTALLVGTRGREDPGTSGNPGQASSVKAVVSLAGGLPTNATINTGDAPTQFFHGTADQTVPFVWAQSNAFAMLAAGVPMNFQAFGNVGHNVFGAQRARIVQQSSYFLYNMLDLRTLAGSASASSAKRAATRTWSGTGDRRLGTITVAEPSILRWRVERGPLSVSAEDGRLRASGVRRSGTATVPAGTLRDVELRTPGRWRIELRPRSASPAR